MPATPLDERTFRALLERTQQGTRHLLSRYRVPASEAEDLVHDALLALILSWERIERPEPWLLGTLRLTIYRFWRSRRSCFIVAVDPATLESLAPPAPPPQERHSLHLDLEALSASLPARQRRLLYFHYRLGMSPQETADHLGRLRESVKRDLHRLVSRTRSLARAAEYRPAWRTAGTSSASCTRLL